MFSLSVTCRCTWTDSSDDDKIVKYLWEEMSGPLQDHTLQDDRNMLTLKDLVPGNYIFKWVHPIYADRLIAGYQHIYQFILTKLNVELCWKNFKKKIFFQVINFQVRVLLENVYQEFIMFMKSKHWLIFISRLTVTDSDGATNSTVANVTVIKGWSKFFCHVINTIFL